MKDNQDLIADRITIQNESVQLAWAGSLGRWQWDCRTGQVWFNPRKVQALGYQVKDFTPTVDAFTALIHEEDYEKAMSAMQDHLTGILPAYEVEYRMRASTGSYRWYYDRGMVVQRDANGRPEIVTGIVFDTTEKHEAEEKLHAAIAARNKFFSILAHDLRGHLSNFLWATEMLVQEQEKISATEMQEYLKALVEGSRKAYGLLDNLLVWGKSQSKVLSIQPESIDLDTLLPELVSLYQQSADLKKVNLEVRYSNNLQVWCDRNSLQTILRNLLSNAIKFTNAKGTVKLKCDKKLDEVFLQVEDTGIGMPADVRESLFKLGTQRIQPGTHGEAGSGFGLVLCAELVERNAGRVEVESAPGRGTKITIYMPSPVNQ